MYVYEFIYQDMNAEQIADFRYYDKNFYLIFGTMEFKKIDENKIVRFINFYKIPNTSENLNLQTISNYKIKTDLIKNYISLLDLSIEEKKRFIKTNKVKLIYSKQHILNKSKNSVIEYMKNNENDYFKRELVNLFNELKERQENQIKENQKFIKKDLKNYVNLINALESLKERDKNIFIYKLYESKEFELKENKKFFLKWTKDKNEHEIKSAIKFILSNDLKSGLNFLIDDYDYIAKESNKRWQTKLYFRDLYLKLFEKYLKESNGNQAKAKELTLKDIETNHRKPK